MHRIVEIFPREKLLILAIRSHSREFIYEYPAGSDPELFPPPDWVHLQEMKWIEPTPEFSSRSYLFSSHPQQPAGELIKTTVFTSITEELESISEEIHALAVTGTPLEEIAIVFPTLSSTLSSLREVLEDFGIPYHAYLGEPLIREPIIGFLLQFFSLVLDAYPREGVISLISSPYFNIRQPDLPRITVADFDYVVRTAGIEGGPSWNEALLSLKSFQTETSRNRSPYSGKIH